MSDRYCYSSDGELFHGDEPTRDDAIREGDIYVRATAKVAPIDLDAVAARVAGVLSDTVIETIGEDVYEIVGEVAEGWPHAPYKSDAHTALVSALQHAIARWLKRHARPSFYGIEDCRPVTDDDITRVFGKPLAEIERDLKACGYATPQPPSPAPSPADQEQEERA